MAKTFNRMPVSVPTPSSSDVKNYFFNHYNWKGLNDDKNILAVDQETFQDCKNVYMDSEGLLRSRPALKVKTVQYTNGGTTYTLSNVIQVWNFGNVTVYESTKDNKYYLTFINSEVENHIQAELKYQDAEGNDVSYDKVRLILADRKIFVFAEHSFNYYDIKENIYANAESFIYIPEVSVLVNGIVDTERKNESPNILTKSYITKYLYDNSESINFNNLVGKEVTVEIDGVKYNVNFVYNNQIVFVGRYTGLSKYNFADDKIMGRYGEGTPLVGVSEQESMIVCSYSYVVDETTKKPTMNWTIYHTVDGSIFTKIPETDGIIGIPKISRDGNYCFVFKSNGPWVYSLLATEGEKDNLTKKYAVWTNLLKHIDSSTYDAWGGEKDFNINETGNSGSQFNQSIQVNGYFRDDTVFAFTYADSLRYTDDIDPIYYNFYCVYSRGGSGLKRKQIFYSTRGASYSYNPTTSSKSVSKVTFNLSSSGITPITNTYTSNNISNQAFNYTRSDSSSITATATLSDLVITQVEKLSTSGPTASTWGTMTFTGKLSIVDSEGNSLANRTISFSKANYAPVNYLFNDISNYNSCTWNDNYFTYKIESVEDRHETTKYRQKFTITAKSISGSTGDTGTKLPVNFGDKEYFASTDQFMPNLYVDFDSSNDKISVAIDFMAELLDCAPYASSYRAIYHIEDAGTQIAEILNYRTYGGWFDCRSPIRDACIVNNGKYTFARLEKSDNNQVIQVDTIQLNSDGYVANATYNKRTKIFSEPYEETFYNTNLVLSDPQGYLLTNKYLFDYIDYTNEDAEYTPIPLLFHCLPVGHYYSGNKFDCIYLATENALYTSNTNKKIEVSELTVGETNYILPTEDTLLSQYYIANGSNLFISADAITEDLSFKWYFPEISKQSFDNEITNLHPISNTEVAIFFNDEVWYVTFDTERQAYRYYKSKLQVGCKQGSDVLTTFDGKYTIFASSRGLVAMSYQDFIASDEQSLTYISDTIYNIFLKYITEENSKNEIKLFKFGYWLMIYKQDRKAGFIYDLRNKSWWPTDGISDVTQFVNIADELQVLCDGKIFKLNKLDTDYFDYDGVNKIKIPWLIKSQKLHLQALNNYKHIVNMTFVSVHDTKLLEQAQYNADSLDFKLQVNNYRKKIDGNINDVEDYTSVNYNVETIRTFVQRLNYSKVNEFQYQLSYDEENAIEVPLSINSISIKYKVGGQVR